MSRRRTVAASLAVALLAAGACSGGADPDPDETPGDPVDHLAGSCEPFMRFLGVQTAQAPVRVPQDPRVALAELQSVEAPDTASAAEVAEWDDWVARRASVLYTGGEISFDTPDLYHDLMSDCLASGYEQEDFGVSLDDADLPPFADPPDDGGIEVVEQGVQAMGADSAGDEMASYGVILENTSDLAVVNVSVSVSLVDDAGEPVHDASAVGTDVVPVLRPGERYGIGRTLYVDRPGAASVEVTGLDPDDVSDAGDVQWWPVDHDLITFPEIAVDPPTIVRSDNESYVLELTFESELATPARRDVFAIFRDGDDRVVGGVHELVEVRPGRGFGEIYEHYIVPGADHARTEVYM